MSVVDLQLGRMMEDSRAGRARECVATKCTDEPRHGRTAQVSARHVDQWTRTADHPTTAEWRTGHSETLLEGTILIRKHGPWHSFKRSCISISCERLQEPGWCHRSSDNVFERLVGDYETSSGRGCWVYKLSALFLLERVPPELRTHLLLTCGSRSDLRHHETDLGELLSGGTVMVAKAANVSGRSTTGNGRRVR